jgi:beta-lactamase superfamily II metal-dependent hydrolase
MQFADGTLDASEKEAAQKEIENNAQYKKILDYIDIAKAEGARCILGGGPATDSALPGGHWQVGFPWRRTPSLVVFDVGEGGAVLVREGHCHWLLDCGSVAQAGQIILPALGLYGVHTLDGLLHSHADTAHVAGAQAVFETLAPTLIVKAAGKDRSPQAKRTQQGLLNSGANLSIVHAGMFLPSSPTVNCEVLYPPPGHTASVADDNCLVVRWSTPFWSILYTADAGFPSERWLLEQKKAQLRADIWIRGSHGRELTGTDEFVRAVNPKVVIVANSLFQRNAEALQTWALQWRQQGITVWLQKDVGAVEAWPGKINRVRSFLTGEEFLWNAEPAN